MIPKLAVITIYRVKLRFGMIPSRSAAANHDLSKVSLRQIVSQSADLVSNQDLLADHDYQHAIHDLSINS